MGGKLLWTGLTLTLASEVSMEAGIVGLIMMAIGCVLLWLDK